jgi:hypothetical protein
MYITILDFKNGMVEVRKLPAYVDAEEYVSENYGLDNTEYLVTDELKLNIDL